MAGDFEHTLGAFSQGAVLATSHGGGKEATQARILQSAGRLFVERGYRNASISAIAAKAGVSRSAVFWHFRDKANLFHEVCRRFIQPFLEKLNESSDVPESRKKIFELFAVYERFVDERAEMIETFLRWTLESPEEAAEPKRILMELHDRFTDQLRETIETLIPDRGEAEAIAAGLVSLMDGNLLLSLLNPDAKAQERRASGLRALAEAALPRR